MIRALGVLGALLLCVAACTASRDAAPVRAAAGPEPPGLSDGEVAEFLHGSMSAEVFPERVLRAFVRANPDLFPRDDLATFGLIPDPAFGWPIGFSRRTVAHLGGLTAVGVNCAACHVAEIVPAAGGAPVRVIGAPSHFDAEAFFGAVTVATFRASQPAGMRRFLAAYLAAGGATDEAAARRLDAEWQRQAARIAATVEADPVGATGAGPGGLQEIAASDLRLDAAGIETGMDLGPLVRALLRLFHNVRAALHIPDQLPAQAPPASGPGRNDAFGLLSAGLLGVAQPYAPVKYGIVWNLAGRRWVHWDGNTESPIGRNLLAALGLGAPLVERRGLLDLAAVQRQTDLSERVRAPRYPFGIDSAAAQRGAATYAARCAACHEGPESDTRLRGVDETGTDPRRAQAFTAPAAERLNGLLASLEIPGYRPSATPGIRATGRYWTPSLAGVWARGPYLHNGSVRTMAELLTPPARRATTFRRGSPRYDTAQMGYVDDGGYRFDATSPGNAGTGHAYGTDLTLEDRRDLIEYLKTL
jgi:hypothetical protein